MSTRPIAAVPALLLVLVSLWEVCATRHAASSVPDDDDWRAAAAILRAEYKPGELIVFAPGWVDPVGRMHVGDLMSIDMAARMDAAKYATIWELSIRGARAPETAGLTPVSVRGDGVEVRRYEQRPAVVLADLRERLPSVRVEHAGQIGPALVLAEVGFEPHRCVQVIPSAGKPVRITFPAVPLGSQLVGYVGLADIFTRRDVRLPGMLDIEIDHKPIATATAGVDDGWVRFSAATTPGSADVDVIVRADAPQRLICFAVETRQ